MDFHLVICWYLALVTGILGKQSRIFGGRRASISDYPHMVSLRTYESNNVFCGGSIISRWNILTSARCLNLLDNNYSDVRIYSGSISSIDTNVSSYEIENVHFHPEFIISNLNGLFVHDIAVVKLRTPIQFNTFQNKIALPSRPADTDNLAVIVGWGMTDYPRGGVSSPILNVAPVTVLNSRDCGSILPVAIDDFQICTIAKFGTGICVGDGGGSVASNREIYGIISYSFNCARGVPDVHTAVYNYLDFIRSHMVDN